MNKFRDEQTCRDLFVDMRWNGKPVCPHCGCDKSYRIENGKRFKCGNKECYKKYSVTVGTIFEASNIPLTTWFPAMYLIASHKKGISSVQLAKDLGVTQKTAWFMLHRIREALKDNSPGMLVGTIEADEAYLSRKYRSDYKGLSEAEIDYNLSNQYKGKGVVFGMAQRDGKVVTKAFSETGAQPIRDMIKASIAPGSTLYTDESNLYSHGLTEYNRGSVHHGKREWVRGDVHINHIENFFGVMKRGIYGIYHQISYKHCQRYCDEFAARYNTRYIEDGQRFSLVLGNIAGRLTYKRLVHGEGSKEENTQTTGQ